MLKDLKLCYVERIGWGMIALYYMDKDAKDVWGDDWDDIPYEHNAGEPYVRDGDTMKKVIIEAAFPSSMKVPCDEYDNSPYSVEMINTGEIPWVTFTEDGHIYSLKANSTLEELYRIQDSGEIEITIYEKRN